MKKIITVDNLVKKYNKAAKNAVDNISFYVEEGAFFSLLGPNGAGKTTTISILTTTLSKTSGDIKIGGYDIDTESSKIRKNIGVIFQNPSLDLNLTAEENIRLHTMLYGMYPFRPSYALMPKEYKNKVAELSEVLGLTQDEIFGQVKSFSGGMKRKLEIIRSLTHSPKVLFLDEPTTGLDPASRKNLWEYLRTVREKEKTTIFLTTHYLEEAEESDYLVVITNGTIESQGSPKDIKGDLVEDYMLVDVEKQQRQELEKELHKLKLSFTRKGPFKIQLNKRTAHEIIKSIKTPLKDIQIHTPTLEEAYLEIIEKTQPGEDGKKLAIE